VPMSVRWTSVCDHGSPMRRIWVVDMDPSMNDCAYSRSCTCHRWATCWFCDIADHGTNVWSHGVSKGFVRLPCSRIHLLSCRVP